MNVQELIKYFQKTLTLEERRNKEVYLDLQNDGSWVPVDEEMFSYDTGVMTIDVPRSEIEECSYPNCEKFLCATRGF